MLKERIRQNDMFILFSFVSNKYIKIIATIWTKSNSLFDFFFLCSKYICGIDHLTPVNYLIHESLLKCIFV